MANKYCKPLFKISPEHKARVKLPDGTFYAGDVVLAEDLDTSISGNIEVYGATPISDYTSEIPCILVNAKWEQLSDGRRPAGNPDISTYNWADDDVLIAIRLHNDLKFEIADDCLDNPQSVTVATGVYMIPQNSDYQLKFASSVGSSASALKIEARQVKHNGGLSGDGYFNTSIVRVTKGR